MARIGQRRTGDGASSVLDPHGKQHAALPASSAAAKNHRKNGIAHRGGEKKQPRSEGHPRRPGAAVEAEAGKAGERQLKTGEGRRDRQKQQQAAQKAGRGAEGRQHQRRGGYELSRNGDEDPPARQKRRGGVGSADPRREGAAPAAARKARQPGGRPQQEVIRKGVVEKNGVQIHRRHVRLTSPAQLDYRTARRENRS